MNAFEPAPLRPHRFSATALSLGLLAVIAVGAVLKAAQGVVLPLLVAWLLSYLLAPAVNFLVRRLRFPAPLAVGCVVALLLLATWGVGLVVQHRLMAFAKAFPAYEAKIATLYAHFGRELDEFRNGQAAHVGTHDFKPLGIGEQALDGTEKFCAHLLIFKQNGAAG